MKKILFILCLIISIRGLSQFPINATNGSPTTGVMTKGRLTADSLFQINTTCYADTSVANLGRVDEIAGAMIRTCDNTIWLRNTTATKWIASGGSSTTNITNIYNNSIVNIFVYHDSCVILQTGSGTNVDTICTQFDCGITGWTIISSTQIEICGFICPDTTTIVCDTFSLPSTPLYYFYNGLTQNPAGVVRWEGNLVKNTTIDIGYNVLYFNGTTVYDAPTRFYQNNYFQNGTGIASFLNHGYGVSPALKPISTRLIVNFTGDDYNGTPPTNVGYYNNQIGYWLGTNTTGNGSSGLHVDDTLSKSTGIFFNTYDTTLTDGISLYAVPHGLNNNNIIGRSEMYDHRVLVGHTNGRVQFPQYVNIVDANTDSALYIGANGEVKKGKVNTGIGTITKVGNVTSGAAFDGTQGSTFTFLKSSTGTIKMDNATGSSAGAELDITGGNGGSNAAGGGIIITAGTGGSNGGGGGLSLIAGTGGSSGGGGNLILTPGAAGSGGGNGSLIINNLPNGGTSNDSALVITSTNTVKKRSISSLGTNIYNSDGTVTDAVRSVALGTNSLNFNSTNSTSTTTSSALVLNANSLTSGTGFYAASSTLTSGSLVDLAITGTAALDNQKGINIDLSGANVANDKTTYGLYISNTHTGSGSTFNYGLYSTTPNNSTNSVAVYGLANYSGSIPIYGRNMASGGEAILGQSDQDGYGVLAVSQTGVPFQASTVAYPTTNDVSESIQISKGVDGTAADGMGSSIAWYLISGGGFSRNSNNLISKWTTAADATRTSQIVLQGINSATTTDLVYFNGDGTQRWPQYGAGALTTDGSGNITATSDIRKKDVQRYFKTGLNAIMNINPIVYKWKKETGFDTKGTYVGFSAQNVKVNIPYSTGQMPNGDLTLQDRAVIATMINAMKEMEQQIIELQKEIIKLKRK